MRAQAERAAEKKATGKEDEKTENPHRMRVRHLDVILLVLQRLELKLDQILPGNISKR